jgi:putative tryptophan/tyrosine transport system substrate-binding protein
MRRRDFLGVVGGAAAPWPLLARAQQRPEGARQVGILLPFAETDPESRVHIDIFRKRLNELGWTEDRNFRIVIRYGAGSTERIRNLAKELVASKPDVILGRSTPVTKSILLETKSIPTIFVVVSDPVGDGIVSSIARPGGNVTGFTNVEASLGGKWLEVLKEMSPTVVRAAVIFDPKTSPGGGFYYSRLIESAASLISIKTVSIPVHDAGEIEHVIVAFAREPNGGLIVLPDVTTGANRDLIVRLAAAHHLPAIYSYHYIVEAGGLASYGVDVGDLYRRAADYVDRVLRGEQPGDLPVQAPLKFELVINLKTAKALGLTLPPTLLGRADEVIE